MKKLDNMHYLFKTSTLQMFLEWFFLSSFRHSKFLNNTSGFEKWACLNIHLDNWFWCECLYIFIWFHFTSHNYFCKNFFHNWVVENSSYNFSTRILQIAGCDVFRQKHFSAIVDTFCKSTSINHKCWICLLIFTFVSTSEAPNSK